MQKYIAEFIGTFILATAVSLSLTGVFPVPTPVIAGMALGLCVYTLGSISGTHINPAITIGLLVIQKITPKDAAFYIAAQFAGGGAAMVLTRLLTTPTALQTADTLPVIGAEALGAFILATGVAAVVYGNTSQGASGLTIGGSLLLGISMAAIASNGVLNPAVAMAIGSFSVAYAIGPVIGAVLAMVIYRYLAAR